MEHGVKNLKIFPLACLSPAYCSFQVSKTSITRYDGHVYLLVLSSDCQALSDRLSNRQPISRQSVGSTGPTRQRVGRNSERSERGSALTTCSSIYFCTR